MFLSIKTLLLILLLLVADSIKAQSATQESLQYTQQNRVPNQPLFKLRKADYKLSPYTGMSRQHWKDAALYLLTGAFSYIDKLDDPMQFPKLRGKSYPRDKGQVPTEKLEGFCRTLFVADGLLKENPELRLNKIKVADYYRYQLTKLSDSTSATFIKHRAKNAGPSQILVEFGGLSVSLFAIPEILWDPLSQPQKDALAATMLSYGDGPTIGNNWKFFNIFVLSFFKSRGYKVNEKLLEEYVQKSLEHYKGDGWYHDAPAYDYYSMWAFQMYGTLWSEFFGKKYYPKYAQRFHDNFTPMKDNYPYMFSKNGEMIMWGRSISYRMGAIVPFPLMGLENDANTNYGWMRRIASGVLLQFLKNPYFLQDNIPTLGFYKPFEPAVQPYSCRGSVFWLGKAFLGLLVPESNPFWNAKENEGAWGKQFVKGTVYNKFEDSSHILITNYPNIGASEIRAWCNVKAIGASEPFRASENYNRLSYNTAFPWQADSVEGVVSMNYIFKNKKDEWEPLRLYSFRKFEDNIYYRDVVLETNKNIKLSLADIPLANGILRVDKNNSTDAAEVRSGHYALPKIKGNIKKETRKVKGYEVQIINNGTYQLAMIPLSGWDKMQTITTKGVHPQSDESAVINVANTFSPQQKDKMYITLMLWKKAGQKWTDDELMPIKNIIFGNKDKGVVIFFKNSNIKTVNFN